MSTKIPFLWFLILLILANTPINTIQASAVPIITNHTKSTAHQKVRNKKNRIKKQHKKQFKKRFKILQNTQTEPKGNFGNTLKIILGISWYPIAIGLLITALVLGITPLLVIAIILLVLPVLTLLILGLILIIGLMTFEGSLC